MIVAAIKKIEAVNWPTTNTFLNVLLFNPPLSFPFKTTIGLNEDNTKAGYTPAKKPTTNGRAIRNTRYRGCKRSEICNCFADKLLNHDKQSHEMATASPVDRTVVNMDSVKNCLINDLFSEPTTLRIPTSFARLADLAVERFMKLIQASINTNKATAEKMYTYWIFPFTPNSGTRSDRR